MCRLLAVLVPFVFVALAPATPVPRERQQPTRYHPTKKGTKWVYNYDGHDETLVVTSAEQKGECWIVEVCAEEEDAFVPRWTVVVHEKGIHQLANKEGRFCKPRWVLKLPAKAGDSWERGYSTATVGAIEKVEVPAGTFTAIRIDWELGCGSANFWYAADVGLVKVKYEGKLSVLKSFTPVKE